MRAAIFFVGLASLAMASPVPVDLSLRRDLPRAEPVKQAANPRGGPWTQSPRAEPEVTARFWPWVAPTRPPGAAHPNAEARYVPVGRPRPHGPPPPLHAASTALADAGSIDD